MKQGGARSSEGDGNSLPARGFPRFTTEGVRREEGFFLRGRSYSHWPHSRFEGCWQRQSRRVAQLAAEGRKETGTPRRTQRSLGELETVQAGTWPGASKTGVWDLLSVETGCRWGKCCKG